MVLNPFSFVDPPSLKVPTLKSSLKRSEGGEAAAAPPSPPAAMTHAAPQLADVRELLGPAWIIEGEDPERYEQLLARVAEAIGPIDFIDWLLVKDFVAHTWEIQRSRRHRETVIRMGRRKALREILDQAMPEAERSLGRESEIKGLATEWLNGESNAAKRVSGMLHGSGFSIEDVAVHATTVMAVQLERIDLQVERNESRRDSLLRQIERRREGWAKRVQRATEDIVEAEFREVPARDLEPSAAVAGRRSGA
jgi:hypothetical protein